MKIKSASLIISFIILSCKSISGDVGKFVVHDDNDTKINARLIICSGISKAKIPLDNLK